MKKQFLFVIAAAISCSAIWLTISQLSSSDNVSTAAQSNTSTNKAESLQARAVHADHLSSSLAHAASENKRNFLDKYNKARSYRAFLYDILREPKKGGLAYQGHRIKTHELSIA
jgi:hypothetical protein